MKYDVAVVADLCLDILIVGKVKPIYGQVEQLIDDYAIEIGGSAAIFASQFTKLGGKIGFIGAVGKDHFGEILLNKLKSIQISTEHITIKHETKTAVGLGLSCNEDRAMLTYNASLAALTPADILDSKVLDQTRHLHIAGYFLLDQLFGFWPEVLKNLRKKGITTSLDTNWPPNNNWDRVKDLLPFINVFLPNEREAKNIANKTDIFETGKALAEFCDVVAVKRGAKGATVFYGKENFHSEVPLDLRKNLKLVDTTGAGDNFDAGFLRMWLQKKTLKACTKTAMDCGTLSLGQIGGISGQLHKTL